MNAKWIILFFLFFYFTGFYPLWGQSTSESLYRHLSESSLLIRLPSQEKKVEALQKTLTNPELSPQAKTRLQAQLDDTLIETDLKNRTIVRTFQEYFSAIPLFFVYDTTHHPRKTDYLDENLQAIQTTPTAYIIQLRFGRPLVDSGNRPESLVLTDEALQDLDHPFPKPLSMTGIGYGINKLLAPNIAFERMLERRVKKLNGQIREMVDGGRPLR